MNLYCSQRLSEALEVYADVADDTEISLLGRIEVEDQVPTLTDIRLIPQTGDASATHIKMEDLVAFVSTLGSDAPAWRCWIHTHPTKARPSYSPEDDDTLGLLAQLPDWYIGVVLNSAGLESRVYLAMSKPFPILEPVGSMRVLSALTEAERDAILQDVVSNVHPPEAKPKPDKRGNGRDHDPKAIVVAREHAQDGVPLQFTNREADQMIWDMAAQMGPPKKHKDAFLYELPDKTLVWGTWDYKKNKVKMVAPVNLNKVAKEVVENVRKKVLDDRESASGFADPPYGTLPEDGIPVDGGDVISLEEFLRQERALAPTTTRPGDVSAKEGD